jgi:hypothetical protein
MNKKKKRKEKKRKREGGCVVGWCAVVISVLCAPACVAQILTVSSFGLFSCVV